MKTKMKRRFMVKGQITRIKTIPPRNKDEGFRHFAKIRSEDGTLFEAVVSDFDEVCRVGRMTPALIELDQSPFPKSFTDVSIIERISRA